jgi:hypothetical protein
MMGSIMDERNLLFIQKGKWAKVPANTYHSMRWAN